MKILGYIPTSFSDWDGKLVSVLFLGGCNFNCPFCQNYPLLEVPAGDRKRKPETAAAPVHAWNDIAAQLATRRPWIDGVVISGGEPLLHPEVFGLCERIKRMGFAVKLDTNGSFPYVLMDLAAQKLIDYVAMDVKTSLDERYEKACGGKLELGLVERSLQFLLEGKLSYELRTTLVPGLVGKDELTAVARRVKGARRFALQQFVPENARSSAYRKKKPLGREQVMELAEVMKTAVKEVVIRGKVPE